MNGILISYLNKATIFVPDTREWIPLPDIPNNPREWFTLTRNIICGGSFSNTTRSCLQLSESGQGWEPFSTELHKPRTSSSSWESPEGILLMGGIASGNTTELVTSHGSIYNVTLKSDVRLYMNQITTGIDKVVVLVRP